MKVEYIWYVMHCDVNIYIIITLDLCVQHLSPLPNALHLTSVTGNYEDISSVHHKFCLWWLCPSIHSTKQTNELNDYGIGTPSI